jgi:hypothetical protein
VAQALRSAPAGPTAAFCYERRRPEETTLYQVVQEQFETFLAHVEAKTNAGLPEFVKDEFEAFRAPPRSPVRPLALFQAI